MAYCEAENLMIGDIVVTGPEKTLYINDAADEMDSYLGTRYVTPIVLDSSNDATNPPQRAARLALKRINAQLASGRIITSKATGGEDTDVHAYGLMLISNALAAIEAIRSGEVILPGGEVLPGVVTPGSGTSATAPLVANGDPYSQVDAFYAFTTPGAYMIAPFGISGVVL